MPKPGKESVDHLWLIITEPAGEPPEVVIVNLTSYREGVDTTVVLSPEDHSFIDHSTIVFYADARIVPLSLLQDWVAFDRNRIHPEKCSTDLLTKIAAGLFRSPFTARKIKKYCADKLINPD